MALGKENSVFFAKSEGFSFFLKTSVDVVVVLSLYSFFASFFLFLFLARLSYKSAGCPARG
jgi:hypothetical protein